jgi:hypothetical protein
MRAKCPYCIPCYTVWDIVSEKKISWEDDHGYYFSEKKTELK